MWKLFTHKRHLTVNKSHKKSLIIVQRVVMQFRADHINNTQVNTASIKGLKWQPVVSSSENLSLLKLLLTIHKYIHSGEKPNQYKACCNAMSSSYQTIHKLLHTVEKSYRPKVTASSDNQLKGKLGENYSHIKVHLTVHKWVHSGEKPNQCTACGHAIQSRSYQQYTSYCTLLKSHQGPKWPPVVSSNHNAKYVKIFYS